MPPSAPGTAKYALYVPSNDKIHLWRPDTAIEKGAPGLNPEPGWQPLSHRAKEGPSFSPAHPSYVSGHATFAGAWESVLASYFGTNAISFSADTADVVYLEHENYPPTRTFSSLSDASAENADSRIWLGVHFSWDAVDGLDLGRRIGKESVSARPLT